MPEPGLTIWILGLPFILAIVDLIRTFTAIRQAPNSERGSWSRALGVGGAAAGARPAAVSRDARPSTLAPGLR